MSETNEQVPNQNTADANDLDEAIRRDEAERTQGSNETGTARQAETSEDASSNEEERDRHQATEAEDSGTKAESSDEDDEQSRRIAKLAIEARIAKREAKQAQEELARLRGQAPQLNQDEQVKAEATRLAAQKVDVDRFNDTANRIYQDGVKEFKDFDTVLQTFQQAEVKLTRELIEAADSTGAAHKIIRYLGKNIDEAERIVNLPPHRMGVELAKLQAKADPVKPVTKAPPPIKPIAGRAQAERSIETMPIEEFMKREDEKYWARRRR